jgi:DNA modification methylase
MTVRIVRGDARDLSAIPSGSVHLVATSPPYFGLRAYCKGKEASQEIGREPTPEAYVASLVQVFREVRRALRDDGVCFLNLGDSYAGSAASIRNGLGASTLTTGTRPERRAEVEAAKSGGAPIHRACEAPSKSLLLIPYRVALALQADGWIVRSAIPWIKRNAMPDSVTDRPTTGHEAVFMLTKRARYFWDADAVRQPNALAYAAPRSITRRTGAKTDASRNDASSLHGIGGNAAAYAGMGRNLRTSDLFFAGLSDYAESLRAELAHVEAILAGQQGIPTNEDGEPAGFVINTRPYRGAHFAVWPPALVEPMIRGGTSERGCCPACGAPWRRKIDKPRGHDVGRKVPGSDTRGMPSYKGKTLGFFPACSCPPADPIPCTVLDPFGGSGTTAEVATRLGRDAIVVELNPDYHPLIHERMAKQESAPDPIPEPDDRQRVLFAS